MLPHTEIGITVNTVLRKGAIEQLLFDDIIQTPHNGQRELNFVTFWNESPGRQNFELPIRLEIRSARSDEALLFCASVAEAMQVAVPILEQRIRVRVIWASEKPLSVEEPVKLDMRMDVDVRRKSPSFSHIQRNPDPPDRTTLAPGNSHILAKI